ncbi:MAG TPA: potassium transporter, partial [Gammaproteobacteria bacterium]|nr:potassium transporter [Gammaproteobacteria bacterium]
MTFLTVQRILGALLSMFSFTMLPPIAVAVLFQDPTWSVFLVSFGIVLAGGLALWWPVRKRRRDLRIRDGFLVVALFWVVLGLF